MLMQVQQAQYVAVQQKRGWKHGLFDCFGDMGTCCVACWFPCVTYGQNRQQLRQSSVWKTQNRIAAETASSIFAWPVLDFVAFCHAAPEVMSEGSSVAMPNARHHGR
jgi:Cys-rich protein (TIGR01571 family)